MGTVVVLELVRAQLALSGLMLALGLLAQGLLAPLGLVPALAQQVLAPEEAVRLRFQVQGHWWVELLGLPMLASRQWLQVQGVLQVLASRQGFQAQGLLPVLASRQWFQVQGCWRMEPPPVLLVRFQAGWHCRQLERQVSHCLLGESG